MLRQQVAAAEQSLKSVRLYETGLLPQARLTADASLAAYRVGRVDFFSLLDSRMTVFNAGGRSARASPRTTRHSRRSSSWSGNHYERTMGIGAAALAAAAALGTGYWLGMRSRSAPEPHPPRARAQPRASARSSITAIPWGCPTPRPCRKRTRWGWITSRFTRRRAPAKSGTVKISLDKVQLLGVRTEPAAERELRRAVQAVGTIQANERLLWE